MCLAISLFLKKKKKKSNSNSIQFLGNLHVNICEGPVLNSVQAQVEARILGLFVVVLRDWAWFTTVKWADYKPSGAQSKNPTIIHTSKQEIYMHGTTRNSKGAM